MKYQINIEEDMSDTKRKNIYREIKGILSEIGVPASCGYECELVWNSQIVIKKLINATGKKGFPGMEAVNK